MNVFKTVPGSGGKLAGLVIGGALAFAAMSQPAKADNVHGFCGGGATTTCVDNSTNSPTNADPLSFTFVKSGNGTQSGDLTLVFLVPTTDTLPSTIAVTGTAPGTATLFGVWTQSSSKDLDTFLGVSSSPSNPFSAYTAGGATAFDVYTLDLWQHNDWRDSGSDCRV